MVTLDLDIWDADLPSSGDAERGLYVAISGNTAAGKSSLISEMERRLRARGIPAVGISERVFHHPYLRCMFSNPDRFAFPIQLSFMLQRHLVLLRNLVDLGRTVILERSHFDDVLFVQEHRNSGSISDDQWEAYVHLSSVLHARIPAPDILVLMNPSPETSLRRLAEAETRGDRPKEFPSEEAKVGWVKRWHAMYEEMHQSFRERALNDPHWANTLLLEVDPTQDRRACADAVDAAVRQRHGLVVSASQ